MYENTITLLGEEKINDIYLLCNDIDELNEYSYNSPITVIKKSKTILRELMFNYKIVTYGYIYSNNIVAVIIFRVPLIQTNNNAINIECFQCDALDEIELLDFLKATVNRVMNETELEKVSFYISDKAYNYEKIKNVILHLGFELEVSLNRCFEQGKYKLEIFSLTKR